MDSFRKELFNSEKGSFHLFFAGQAGFIFVGKNGTKLGYDLYFSNYVEKDEGYIGYKRLVPPLSNPKDIILDYLVASHFHLDHFDYGSMNDFLSNGKTKLFCPCDCIKYFDTLKLDKNNITIIEKGMSLKLQDFLIHFVDCDHGKLAPDAVGAIIECDGHRIYIVGDSALRKDILSKVKEFGSIDVLIAPINGAFGNLDEKDCVEVVSYLKPKKVIPCHYGMFAAHGGNPGAFLELMNLKCPETEVLLLQYGEHVVL